MTREEYDKFIDQLSSGFVTQEEYDKLIVLPSRMENTQFLFSEEMALSIADRIALGLHVPGWFIDDDVRKRCPQQFDSDVITSRPFKQLGSIGRLFIVFMSRNNRDAFIGDLEEKYGVMVEEEGHRAAATWLWRQVVHSFLSFGLDALRRVSAIEKLFRKIRR